MTKLQQRLLKSSLDQIFEHDSCTRKLPANLIALLSANYLKNLNNIASKNALEMLEILIT